MATWGRRGTGKAAIMEESKQVTATADRPGGVSNTPPKWSRHMNVCIDYLRVTFAGEFNPARRGMGEFKKLIDTFKVLDEVPVTEEGGKGSYARTYRFGQAMLIFAGGKYTKNAQGQETFSIEMKGKGCREFEDRIRELHLQEDEDAQAKAIHDGWRNLFEVIVEFGGKCTRLDVPTDDYSGLIPVDQLKYRLENRVYASPLRNNNGRKPNKRPDEETGEAIIYDSNTKGWSILLGSPKSVELCVYNKLAEQLQKTNCMFNVEYWIRYEVRYFHDTAVTAFAQLLTAYQNPDERAVVRFIVGCLKDKLDVKDHYVKHIRKTPTWDKWEEFMKEAMEIHIVAQKRPESTIESNARWMMEDTAKCIGKIAGVLHEDMVTALLYLLYEGIGRIEAEELHVINEHLIRQGRPAYQSLQEYKEAMAEAFGNPIQPTEEIKELFQHEVIQLGSAKYYGEQENKPKEEKPSGGEENK